MVKIYDSKTNYVYMSQPEGKFTQKSVLYRPLRCSLTISKIMSCAYFRDKRQAYRKEISEDQAFLANVQAENLPPPFHVYSKHLFER